MAPPSAPAHRKPFLKRLAAENAALLLVDLLVGHVGDQHPRRCCNRFFAFWLLASMP